MVDAVLGEEGVRGVRLRHPKDGACEELACQGVFPFIGGIPNTEFLPDALRRNEAGGLITDCGHYSASVPGIYAIGAVRAGYSGELISAAGEAAAAVKAIAHLA